MRHLKLGLLGGSGLGVGAALLTGVACSSGSAYSGRIGGTGALGGSLGASGENGTGADAGASGQGAGKGGSSGNTGGAAGSGATGGNAGTGTGGTVGSAGSGGLPGGQGVGQDCSASAPCRAGLECLNGACAPSGSTGVGEPCVIGAECAAGLQCVAGGCVPEGDSGAGEECLVDSDCASGLRCAIAGLAATCVPGGSTDAGGACRASTDCFQGLACAGGTCAPQPVGPPVFQGVTCEAPSDKNVRAYFEVPGDADALEGDFFRLPFPNDVRRTKNGLDLSGFPTPGAGALGVDAVKLYVDALEANDDGWGAYPTATFRFSGPLSVESVQMQDTAAWVDVTPGVANPWASVGLYWFYSSGKNQYVCENYIAMRRPRGYPLVPGHTYAAYLTTTVKADGGATVIRPKNLISLLGKTAPPDDVLTDAYAAYAPFRDYLAAQSIDAATILNATVFTVGGVRDTMESVADAIAAADPPEAVPGSWVKCAAGVQSPCPDHALGRDCGDGTADYDEYHALVKLPIFQTGTEPYLTPADGGGIVVKSTQPTEDVCLSLTVPTDSGMPTSGWPLVVFAHGTDGSFRDHVTDSVAGVLSRGSVKFAVLGIDQVEHGPRRGGSTVAPDQLFFNFLNPDAARGNPIQGAADQLSLARFAATIDGTGETPTKVDASALFFFGHSQGSTEGSLMLPYGDAYKAAVLSGNGASLTNALMTKTKPVNIKNLLPIAIADLSATGDVAEFHPVLSLLQQWIDPADPLNYARYTVKEPLSGHVAKHVFQTYGLGDSYAPPVTLGIYATAGGFTQVKPVLDDFSLKPLVDAPLSANEQSSMITLGMRQYAATSGSDGHFVVFDNQEANDDMVRFLSESVGGIPSIGQ